MIRDASPGPLVLAGIDEAGYGPMLGPLCVGLAVFVIDEHDVADGAPNLWARLRSAVCRKPSDKKRRVAVDDSKRLKGSADGPHHPLRHLERGSLAFCPRGDELPTDDRTLLDRWGATVPAHPWFASTTTLPLGHTAEELRIARGRVQRAMERSGVRCERLACRAIDPEQLNRELGGDGGKAGVNFRAAVGLLDDVWSAWPGAHPRVLIDRHGGRTRYATVLKAAFPGAEVHTIAEAPTLSRYRLERAGSRLTVTFAQDGDARFLPVSLASMAAKYVRELMMLRLNRYFQAELPELKPTAGYVQDARRYLRDVDAVVRRRRLSRPGLIRRA